MCNTQSPFEVGDRIQLDRMFDPQPVESNTRGTVVSVAGPWSDDSYDIGVDWDNGRKLGLVVPPDQAHRIQEAS